MFVIQPIALGHPSLVSFADIRWSRVRYLMGVTQIPENDTKHIRKLFEIHSTDADLSPIAGKFCTDFR